VASLARPGLAGLFDAVRRPLQASNGPLEASKRKFEAAQKQYAALRERIDSDDERYRTQLSRSFSAMDRQLTILRATQSYVQQQISAWNSNDS
jgi:flagellar hook-associated protein 2